MQRLRDAAEMLFEPTGDLWKDYAAYCEIEDKAEREDIVDAIQVVELKPGDQSNRDNASIAAAMAASATGTATAMLSGTSAMMSVAPTPTAPAAASKVQTHVIARNLDYCLAKKDAMPLANAIPHCHTLTKLHLTGCGITEHSLKLFVEAVYKSPSVTSVAIDFNPGGLYKDPTVSKKDRNEVFVNPSQYRGLNQRVVAEEAVDKKGPTKGGAADKGKDKGKPAAPVAEDTSAADKAPIALPTGWHSILLTGITQLSLRGNNITDRQLEPIAALLEANTELLTLSLWGNSITTAGATVLARALKANRRLTSLNLGHNSIDDGGVRALVECLFTMDVPNDEAAKLRAKTLRGSNSAAAELPTLPGYADLFVVPNQAETDKKDSKKKDVGKKGKTDGPVERLRGDFDKDCVRIEENKVRVPGNTALWSLNLSNNARLTAAAATVIAEVLAHREPVYDSGVAYDGNLPRPYCVPSLAIERIDLAHSALPETAVAAAKAALDEFAAYRSAAAVRVATASA
jgi:hypothetical protein